MDKRVGMVAYNYVMATPTEGQPQTSTLSSSTVQWPDISDSETAYMLPRKVRKLLIQTDNESINECEISM